MIQKGFICKALILLAFLFVGLNEHTSAQTMMPMPPHNSNYTGYVRGYWFVAPTDFTITGLKVPIEAGTGPQSIQVMRINGPIAVWSTIGTNFTTLFYVNNATNNTIVPTAITVNAGDTIGILGQANTTTSYGPSQAVTPSTIGGFPVDLKRFIHQGPINVTQAPNYSSEATGSIGRIEMYYTTAPCSGQPTAGTVPASMEVCPSTAFSIQAVGATAGGSMVNQWQQSLAGQNNWNDIAGATMSTFSSPGITVPMDYRYITTCTPSGLSDTSTVVTTTILPTHECYCTPTTNSTSYYIDSFATAGGVQNIQNGSTGMGQNGYQNFSPTDTVAQIHGQDISFHIKGNSSLTAGAKIWVDWNKNGVFDANEMMFSTTSYSNSHQGTFTVPMTATTGVTRMRIGWHGTSSTGPTDPCQNNMNGEFEDYAFEVIPLIDCSAASTPSGWAIEFNNDSLCLVGDVSMTVNEQIYASNVTYLFQQSTDGVNWTNVGVASTSPNAVATDVDQDTHFRVIWLCSNVGIDTAVGTVYVIDPEVPVATSASRCGPGDVTLTATANAGEIRWYDNDIGGTLLGTGGSFTTPYLTNSTTYWVAAGLGGSGGGNDSLHTLSSGGNGCSGGTMFNLTAQSALNVDSFTALATGSGSVVKVYYREGGYVGFNQNAAAWTLHETINMSYGAGNIKIPLSNPIELDANTTYGIYVFYNASYTNGTAANSTHSNADLLFEGGDGLCSEFSGVNVGRIFNGTIHYSMGGCESDLVAVEAIINPEVNLNLPNTLNLCTSPQNPGVLDAGSHPDNVTYLWDNSSTERYRTVFQSGSYSVTVTNEFGCSASDTIDVTIRHNPAVDLGPDTTLCLGGQLELDAGPDGEVYTWSNGSLGRYSTISTPGTYTVMVEAFNGCVVTDTIVVAYSNQEVADMDGIAANNISQNTFKFSAINPQNVTDYFWHFGDGVYSAEAEPTHTYAERGNYIVTLEVGNDCGAISDSISTHMVSIGERNAEDNSIVVYPNPTKGNIMIKNSTESPMLAISITDVTGRTLQEININQSDEFFSKEVNLDKYADGMYWIHVHTEHGVFTKKVNLIKQ